MLACAWQSWLVVGLAVVFDAKASSRTTRPHLVFIAAQILLALKGGVELGVLQEQEAPVRASSEAIMSLVIQNML